MLVQWEALGPCLPSNGWFWGTAPASWLREADRHTALSPVTRSLTSPPSLRGWFTARLWVWSLVGRGKGVVVILKCRSLQGNLATSYMQTAINKTARATLSNIGHVIYKNNYSPDLCVAAVYRASAIRAARSLWSEVRRTPPRALELLPALPTFKAINMSTT